MDFSPRFYYFSARGLVQAVTEAQLLHVWQHKNHTWQANLLQPAVPLLHQGLGLRQLQVQRLQEHPRGQRPWKL